MSRPSVARGRPSALVALAALALSGAAPLSAQIPEEFTNLQVLPRDISQDSLVSLMRSFTFATGIQCVGCHVMGEGGSFQGARFDLDDKTVKLQAREMLRMVHRINGEMLTALPDRDQPPLQVECKTCHRGLRRPYLLRTELRALIDRAGIDAATARYRDLRAERMDRGIYDFGVWEMNELARELERDGLVAEAAAILELNEEFHPRDPSSARDLGLLYERLDRTEDAIAAYRRALGLNPSDTRSLRRLQALAGGAG